MTRLIFKLWQRETIDLARPRMADEDVHRELALCECLMGWDAFAAPDAPLVEALGNLATINPPKHLGLRCLLRQVVVDQLMYETAHADTLPACMQHHAAARYRLRSDRVTAPMASRDKHHENKTRRAADNICAENIPDVDKLRDEFCEPCAPGHTCLDTFQEQPQIVRNWRILWRSRSPAARREALLVFHRADLAEHRRRNNQGQWNANYTFLGVHICRVAFLKLTGIGASSLVKARESALRNHLSSMSFKELNTCLRIVNTNQEPLYMDARQWLEHYADTHGEQSPMDCVTFLPSGRKQFYYTPL